MKKVYREELKEGDWIVYPYDDHKVVKVSQINDPDDGQVDIFFKDYNNGIFYLKGKNQGDDWMVSLLEENDIELFNLIK